MKRTVLALGLFIIVATSLVAETSAYYPVRVDVVKLFAHADGYRVIYRKGAIGMAEIFLPIKWFAPGGKGQIIRANDPSYPYLTVYYKDGAFSHVRLYVSNNYQDDTWGVLPANEGKGKFDVEDIKLEF